MKNRKPTFFANVHINAHNKADYANIPSDNIGNSTEIKNNMTDDAVGNTKEGKPAHLESGILHGITHNNFGVIKEIIMPKVRVRPTSNLFSGKKIKKVIKPATPFGRVQADFALALARKDTEDFLLKFENIAANKVRPKDVSLKNYLKNIFNKINFLLTDGKYNFKLEQISKPVFGYDAYFFFIKVSSSQARYIVGALRKVLRNDLKKVFEQGYGAYIVLSQTKEAIFSRE